MRFQVNDFCMFIPCKHVWRSKKYFSAADLPLPIARNQRTDARLGVLIFPLFGEVGKNFWYWCEIQFSLVQRNFHFAPRPCLDPVFSTICNELLHSLQTTISSKIDCKQSGFTMQFSFGFWNTPSTPRICSSWTSSSSSPSQSEAVKSEVKSESSNSLLANTSTIILLLALLLSTEHNELEVGGNSFGHWHSWL